MNKNIPLWEILFLILINLSCKRQNWNWENQANSVLKLIEDMNKEIMRQYWKHTQTKHNMISGFSKLQNNVSTVKDLALRCSSIKSGFVPGKNQHVAHSILCIKCWSKQLKSFFLFSYSVRTQCRNTYIYIKLIDIRKNLRRWKRV